MVLSPGAELVWQLSAREAILTKSKDIEPDHIFCALLKFAEMEDNEIDVLQSPPEIKKELKNERNQVQGVLKQRSIPTSKLRYDLRSKIDKGGELVQDGVMHRSDEARRVFDQAARQVSPGDQRVRATHLLQVLLDHPSAVLAKLIGPQPKKKETESATTHKGSRPGAPHLIDLRQKEPEEVPEVYTPQVSVLTWALRDARPQPLLLVCAENLPIEVLASATAEELDNDLHFVIVDPAAIAKWKDLPDEEELFPPQGDWVNTAVLMDLNGQNSERVSAWLQALHNVLDTGQPRLVLAVQADCCERLLEVKPELDGLFRLIWLHELNKTGKTNVV